MQKFYETLVGRLDELHAEILKALDELPAEALDWQPAEGMNSIGVLVVHLTGAERYWIGDVLKGEPFPRDREAEFHVKGLDAKTLKQRVIDLDAYEEVAFEGMELGALEEERTSPRDGRKFLAGWALMHALEHTALHVGHIQIQSQLWKQSGRA
jgi:uncharacterized damage-inducible protein DinB